MTPELNTSAARAGSVVSIGHQPEVVQRPTVKFGSEEAKEEFYDDSIGHVLAFVAKNHRRQIRKGTETPYLSHLQGVSDITLQYMPKEFEHPELKKKLIEAPSAEFPNGITRRDAFMAALLHDVIEDQGGKEMEDKVRAKFGDTVTKLVLYCSDLKDEHNKSLSYRERKIAYLTRIAAGPSTAMLVSASDKLHNLRTSVSSYLEEGEDFWKRFGPKKEEKLQYYRDVIDIFGATGKHPKLIRDIALNYHLLHLLMGIRNIQPWQTLTSLFRLAQVVFTGQPA